MRDQRVYLNGISLESVHPAVLLQHIDEQAPEVEVKTGERAGGPGVFVTSRKLTKRQISVAFAIRERLDFALRAEVSGLVMAWAAAGGWLELSSRPGLRIWVDATQLAGPGKLREWTQDYTMIFTAHSWPLWLEGAPYTVSLENVTTGTAQVSAAGNHPTRLEAEITPRAATLTAAELTVCGETMSLTGLSVPAGTALRILWDERHLLRITAGGTGLLGHRTGDDLVMTPGRHEAGYSLSTACDVKLMARGCWL